MNWCKLVNRKPVAFKHNNFDDMNGFIKETRTYITDFRKRKVRTTYIGKIRISTVFLGFNHSSNDEVPLLFETMVFGADREIMFRCSTWREALKQHQRALLIAKCKRCS